MKYLSLSLFLIFVSISLFSQETKRIHKENSFINEVYFVLKDDKSIKQGKYLKYRKISKDLNLPIEYGNYERNYKTGTWLIFNESLYQNPIRIVAEYANGKKNGQWIYFYAPDKPDNNSNRIIENRRLSNVIVPRSEDSDINITIDTSGIKIVAIGSFLNNKKVGKWSYYKKNGQLEEEYDFSLKKSIYSSENDTIDQNYTEAVEYFLDELLETIKEKIMIYNYYDPLTFSFELFSSDNGMSIKNLSNNSSIKVWDLIEKSMLSMNRNWMDFDPNLENFSIIIELELQHDQFRLNTNFKSNTPNIK